MPELLEQQSAPISPGEFGASVVEAAFARIVTAEWPEDGDPDSETGGSGYDSSFDDTLTAAPLGGEGDRDGVPPIEIEEADEPELEEFEVPNGHSIVNHSPDGDGEGKGGDPWGTSGEGGDGDDREGGSGSQTN